MPLDDAGGAVQSLDWTVVAGQLCVDHWTAEVVSALHERGIRPVLLKGPAVARWLYSDSPSARSYADIDLLIDPASFGDANDTLRSVGFVPDAFCMPRAWPDHAQVWVRPADGAVVDLHWTFHGMEMAPIEAVWRVMSTESEPCVVGGVCVAIPNEGVRTLLVALHLVPDDAPGAKSWVDLERAIGRIDLGTWKDAAILARRIGADAEMGVRLRRLPAGVQLADRLELPASGTSQARLRKMIAGGELSAQTYKIARLAVVEGWRAKGVYVMRRAFPPRALILRRYPLARKGGAFGMMLAYAFRLCVCLCHLPMAVWGWRRFRRAEKRRTAVGNEK